MMTVHKEMLYREMQELLSQHPHGNLSVDSSKLRILLDLMQRQIDRSEMQCRACLEMVINADPSAASSSPLPRTYVHHVSTLSSSSDGAGDA
jgi:hypothetical protein